MIFYIILFIFVGCLSSGPGLQFATKTATYSQTVTHKSIVDDIDITTITNLTITSQNDTNNDGVRVKVVTEDESNQFIGSAKIIGNVMTVTMDDGTTETFTLSQDDLDEVRQLNLEDEVMRNFDRKNRSIDENIEITDAKGTKRQININIRYDEKGREVYSKISKQRDKKLKIKSKEELKNIMDNLDRVEQNATRVDPLESANLFDEISDIDGINEDYETSTTYDPITDEISQIVDTIKVGGEVILTSTIDSITQSYGLTLKPAIT